MPEYNVGREVFLTRKANFNSFFSNTFRFDGTVNEGETEFSVTDTNGNTVDLVNTYGVEQGDTLRTGKQEYVEVVNVSGNDVEIKNGISRSYGTISNIYYDVLDADTGTYGVVRILPRQIRTDINNKLNKTNSPATNFGTEFPLTTVSESLKNEKSYTVDGYVVDDHIKRSQEYIDDLKAIADAPMHTIVLQSGSVQSIDGILKRVRVTQDTERMVENNVRRDGTAREDLINESYQVKLDFIKASKR